MLKQVLKAALVAALVSGAYVAGPAMPQARAQTAEVSFSVFYQDLAAYGRWFQHPRWGWVWFPTAVDADWRPYTRGRWVLTAEHGWYWEAEEPFGWAVYHYGRWAYDEQYGWTWVPGTVWGPAWVAFREGDGYAGWAPLPPETLYDTAPSYESPYTEMSADYYQPRWVFVSFNYFLSPRVGVHAARWSDNRRYFGRTRNVTRYSMSDRRVAHRSLAPERLRAAIRRAVVTTRINDVRQPGAARPGRRDRANVVNTYRPQIRASTDAAPPPAARARPNDRPRAAIRREAVPPSERRRIERGTPGTTPPSTVTRPDAPPPRTVTRPTQPPAHDAPPPRRMTPPSTVARPPQPPTQAAPPPRRMTPPSRVARPPQPPTHAAPPPRRMTPPSRVARPPQPPTHAAPPPRRMTPPSRVARPPQPPTHAAPPPRRMTPPSTVARPPQPPMRAAPPPRRVTPPSTVARPPQPPARPAAPPPAKPAARPSCGGPGRPCPR